MSYFAKTDLSHLLSSSLLSSGGPTERKRIPEKRRHSCDYEHAGFCKTDCPSKHSSKGIICRNSLIGGCSDNKCRYQHPHPRRVEKTLQSIYVNKGLDSDDDQKKFLKRHVVKCPIHMAKDVCSDPLCNDSKCNKQHFVDTSVTGIQAFDLQKTLNGNTSKLVDCPPSSFEYELLISTWKEKRGQSQIVKVEKVINPSLEAVIERRKAELLQQWQEIDFLFHGTSEATIQLILANGFDATKNTRAAWGPGIYFAFDPNTAIGYSNEKGSKKLIVCKAFLAKDASDHKFVAQNTWFVVQNTSGLQPMYVLTLA
ncbi:predicted protein [Naegleria gruberi]|uniref:Predicted protein n=1 Tax=Naegleria gruberi TaxID=5762 RepID=D2VNE4_NAEGR|nr:uncharacterized protein NAEGRDRAFT_50978 [Naegleria gruberi]EFC41643.1 predicted protein [Naegleria gruberi]|eukprot:XP_002674387.1 predicted protein [Naegleria gruberi strain NEG-M]